jgi:hypothetical protein
MYTLSDEYLGEDLLLNDPKAQAQARVIAQARELGIHISATPGLTEMVSISVADLAELLRR